MTTTDTMAPEMLALKDRLKVTWMSGDYGVFARYLEPGALEILERWDLQPGERVLDVGCGAGQIALPAAARGVDVTGVDIAANLIAQARRRAEDAGVRATFDEGDAERLPYPDASFDTVVSLIGAMFAPRPDRVAAELLRVCRPGGRILLANWTPAGFIGQMFKTIGKHVPPSPLMPSPLLWGDEQTVRDRLGSGTSDLRFQRYHYRLAYPFPPQDVVAFFREYYGPTNRAFAALDEAGQDALEADLVRLWSEHNIAGPGESAIESEYLEVRATRG
ncbi:class I SAM-dependent methyltransferase [Deinococcus peraridilitoris]|uniref:Methylase involved in ubiquinone/menaquinone biosynthesis n=1 Tax=Deinococcus peraridilitoris (strain DSM 19664 / LMG 22246 / CIP 109416 / KR-200) TaxID=937777 RepID=L0A2F9_DEIPD|nr:class I SAM-dependent methyltransferase [Deinococcus peraridilitoris]AFZ67609.1 methylase involved in ubiquinone/menaquinone biosynthesis [Deinococcus peraridilitoris DSM 19664]